MALSFLITLGASLGCMLAIGITVGWLFGATAGFGASALTMLLLSALFSYTVEVGRCVELLDAGDLAGAEASARRIADSRLVGSGGRGTARNCLAATMWLRGEHAQALAMVRRAIAELDRAADAHRPVAGLAHLNEVQLAAITGDVSGAERRLAALDWLPGGDVVQRHRIDTELVLAFESDDIARLPANLSPWIEAVRHGEQGSTVALLAWALHGRGERAALRDVLESGRGLVAKAGLDLAHPRLARWWAGFDAEQSRS